MLSKFLYKVLLITLVCFFFHNFAYAKSSSQKNAELSFEMLAPYTFNQLPPMQQKEYINQIRKAWLDFEKKYHSSSIVSAPIWQRAFFETANAAAPACIIGGANIWSVRSGKKYVCPTTGRSCDGKSDSFRCGAIFSEACISRTPISDLSERCYKESSAKALKKDEYEHIVSVMAPDFEALCSGKTVTNRDGCRTLANKMNDIAKEHSIRIAALEEYNKKPIAAPESTTAESKAAVGEANLPICSDGISPDKRKPNWWLPPFDLSATLCPFVSNRSQLTSLSQNGCNRNNPLSHLFTTGFRSADNSLILGQSSFLEGLIEDVSVQEKKSEDNILYTLQMLIPNTTKYPIAVERKNFSLRQDGTRFYLLDPYSKDPQEVKVSNTNRTTIAIDNVPTTSRQIEGKVHLADNCLLAQQLKQTGLYQPQVPITIPGPAGGTK